MMFSPTNPASPFYSGFTRADSHLLQDQAMGCVGRWALISSSASQAEAPELLNTHLAA
jgi:hypothetical protein